MAASNTPLPAIAAGDVPSAFEQARDGERAGLAVAGMVAGLWRSATDGADGTGPAGNLDIVQAAARLRQADARARQAGAALLPSLGLNANVNTLYGQTGGVSQRETDYNLALGASYELDFWGKNRDAADAANFARDASAADRATVALTATSGVANTYFQLLSLRERLAVAKANLEILARISWASCSGG